MQIWTGGQAPSAGCRIGHGCVAAGCACLFVGVDDGADLCEGGDFGGRVAGVQPGRALGVAFQDPPPFDVLLAAEGGTTCGLLLVAGAQRLAGFGAPGAEAVPEPAAHPPGFFGVGRAAVRPQRAVRPPVEGVQNVCDVQPARKKSRQELATSLAVMQRRGKLR